MSDPTAFLYPFIEREERDIDALTADLEQSARAKIDASHALRASAIARCEPLLQHAASAMAGRISRGARIFFFGNGGSATDAEGAADLFRHPPFGRAVAALSLVDDRAVLTALANDVGFETVFSRQLIAYARRGDIAVGLSTSGESRNLLEAFEEAVRRGVLTVGLAGYEGGAMAASPALEHCLVVPSDSVHRIQEVHNALLFQLWSLVQERLPAGSRG